MTLFPRISSRANAIRWFVVRAGLCFWSVALIANSPGNPAGTRDAAGTIGVVIGGNVAKHVLLRAIGPMLATFGMLDALLDPQFGLQRAGEESRWEVTGVGCLRR